MSIRLALCLFVAGICLPGQNISGSISGTVVDSTDAVLAGVLVTATSESSGFRRTTETNGAGYFSILDLIPGSYSITFRAAGFQTRTQTGIVVGSGEQRSLPPVRLALGETSESVTVTGEPVSVQLGSGEKSGSITQEMLQNIALRGRDMMDAVGLLPGVVDTSDSREAPSPTSIGNLYIAGGRSNSKNMTIDGVTNLDTGSNGSVHSMPSMDSVGEVRILMSNYAAEYGRNSGGSITVITRGGGTKFHASAGWYYRHESFSANNFFNNQRGIQRPPYRYNIAGYTVSGPVYVPGHFNRDRSRLFFFFSQEFQRQRVEYGSKAVTVPTALERTGDFSQTRDVNGALVPIYDPLNGRRQFPGNIVPASRIDPLGRKILDLFPLPNFVDPNPSRRYQWNYISALSGAYPRTTEIVRVDYSPAAKVEMYVRLSDNSDEQHAPYGSWTTGGVNFPLTPIVFRQPGRGATLHMTATLSPTLFSETIFGVSQNKLYYFPELPDRVSRASTGITVPQWNTDLNPTNYIPNMSFGGPPNWANPSMSNGIPYYNSNTIFSVVENVSKVRGTHSFKSGVYVERTRKDQMATANTRGTLSFDRNGVNPYDTNWSWSNALLGYYYSYSEATARPQGQYRFTNFEWYAQDSWRIRPRLLIDYGVRLYNDLPQYDARGQLASFVPSLYDAANAPVLIRPTTHSGQRAGVDPLSGALFPESYIGTFVPAVGDATTGMAIGGRNGYPRGLYSIQPVSFGPRLGFAWDPVGRGRTAIRGGGGVFFDRIQGNPVMDTLSNPPTIFTPTVYYGTLDSLAQTNGKGILAPTGTVYSLTGRQDVPTVYNFSMGVQQQIRRSFLLDISYVGSLTRHALWRRNLNPVPLGARILTAHPENRDPNRPGSPIPDNFLRPYQGYGDILLYEFASTANYNSLQASLNQKLAKGLMYGIAYTFSKTLGTGDSDTYNVSPFFAPRKRNYGLLSFDRPHVFSAWYTYQIPAIGKRSGSRLLQCLVDGWQISGTNRFQSGGVFTPGFALLKFYETSGTPSEGARIDVVDPSAGPKLRFAAPQPGSVGNAGVNILRYPSFTNFDTTLAREFKFEKMTAQLRLETYNTFNHAEFSAVSTGARFDASNRQIDPLFLEPTDARSPRRVQLSVRLNF